jgi:hypothetical protein
MADTVAKRFLVSDRGTFFTLGREWGILIQKSIPSDSIIAHFANHAISAATFATLSTQCGHSVPRIFATQNEGLGTSASGQHGNVSRAAPP